MYAKFSKVICIMEVLKYCLYMPIQNCVLLLAILYVLLPKYCITPCVSRYSDMIL